ncbi:Eukaryotic translation initiation factor 3 subunit M [Fasciolopsis buskii]|uniref:Eukaryotic translation initiation factor 3 subunit M n=1 Tax=Fasciolopsis buskii TaxID=27845 RepID=A0A8E0S273_9TREM|nr:Eukaryotic translation initiation factor 3 subunit M [Fasciolopsis buski]
MRIDIFMPGTDAQVVTELKRFLKNNGAKSLDSSECREDEWVEEFRKCIKHVNVCWRSESMSESDVNDVLTTVATLVVQLPVNQSEVIAELCEQYEDFSGDNLRKHQSKLFSLNLLFHGIPPNSNSKCLIYLTLLSCALKCSVVHQITTDPKKVASWLDVCLCTPEERRKVWWKLHETYSELGESRRATEALVYLLSTYNDDSAAQARPVAIKCIISVMQDPSLLAHDQLYALKPIQFLEGEPVHDFFKIFLSGNLATFKAFIKKHPDFLKQNGLDEDACRHKLRMLTLMQVSENQTEISYDAAVKELELPLEELEPFIIEGMFHGPTFHHPDLSCDTRVVS